MTTMWLIENKKELDFLEALKKRLYSEDRMNGDVMRDFAQRLDYLIQHLIEIDDEHLGIN